MDYLTIGSGVALAGAAIAYLKYILGMKLLKANDAVQTDSAEKHEAPHDPVEAADPTSRVDDEGSEEDCVPPWKFLDKVDQYKDQTNCSESEISRFLGKNRGFICDLRRGKQKRVRVELYDNLVACIEREHPELEPPLQPAAG